MRTMTLGVRHGGPRWTLWPAVAAPLVALALWGSLGLLGRTEAALGTEMPPRCNDYVMSFDDTASTTQGTQEAMFAFHDCTGGVVLAEARVRGASPRGVSGGAEEEDITRTVCLPPANGYFLDVHVPAEVSAKVRGPVRRLLVLVACVSYVLPCSCVGGAGHVSHRARAPWRGA